MMMMNPPSNITQSTLTCLVVVSVRPRRSEERSSSLGGSSDDSVRHGELDILTALLRVVVEGCANDALAVLVGDSGSPDDLEGLLAGTVATSHVIVQHLYSLRQRGSTVLAVHVVSATARVVLDPNSEILHVSIILLRNLVDIQDLSGSLLHLSLSMHEVPESRLGHHLIGRKNLDAVSRRIDLLLHLRVGLRRLAAHHLVQFH